MTTKDKMARCTYYKQSGVFYFTFYSRHKEFYRDLRIFPQKNCTKV